MIAGERGDLEAILFWVGACAFFLCDPFLSAYLFHDFVPVIKGRTPLQAAFAGALFNGMWLLIPAGFFRFGWSLQERKGGLEPRPMASVLAALFGLMTGALTRVTGDLVVLLVVCSAAALAFSRLGWRTQR